MKSNRVIKVFSKNKILKKEFIRENKFSRKTEFLRKSVVFIVTISMILGMTGLGLVSVIVFLYTRHRQIVEKRFLNAALFLILCSL